ncbi:hypothetical protein CROQUDRAFT_650665 [Cronartium quercuum f. sp. fusiforme G11]|uniref:Kinetochore protein Nuf2 n=1 Tax=Cronartium quercuum f. sp. fusiforme G11 TaxID=708437 RepID=A0A9P6NXA8_9BASI|nr:hypothetical protein CROQUDRAFT_650665 [Cronartium quercuum f. sp. fusiforme G11]
MSFPLLTVSEIIDGFRSLGYPGELSSDDITKPTTHKVVHFYEWVIGYLGGITREDLREAVREPLSNVAHPNVYEYRVLLATFKDTLEQFMRCAAIYDFSDRDLTAPTPDRFRRILSGLMNFMLFEAEQSPLILGPLDESLEVLQAQRDQLLAREAELARENTEALQMHEQEARVAAELIPQIEAFKATILECKDMTDPLEQRRAELMNTRRMISEQNRTAVAEAQRLETEISRLSARIARSPETVRSAIDSLQKTLATETAQVNSLESNARLLDQRIRASEKYEKDLSLCLKLADEWEAEMGRAEEVRKSLNVLSEDYEARLLELQEVEKKTAQAQRRTELMQDQLERVHSGILRKRKAGKERQLKAVEEHEAEIRAQAAHEQEWEQLSSLKADIIARDASAANEFTRSIAHGQAAYDKLRSELLHYCMKHTAALQAVDAKLTSDAEGHDQES